jgi:hypothetical protein
MFEDNFFTGLVAGFLITDILMLPFLIACFSK